MGLFRYDGPIAKAMIHIMNLLILNFCFLVCCIPIFTIGAAISALSSVFLTEQESASVFRGFFRGFRANFKQATKAWLIFLLAGGLLGLDFFFLFFSAQPLPGAGFLRIVLYILTFVYMGAIGFAFPLIVKFDNTLFHTLTNACVFSVILAPVTVLMILLTFLPIVCWLYSFDLFARVLTLWFFIGFSLTSQISCLVIGKIFSKLLPSKTADHTAAG